MLNLNQLKSLYTNSPLWMKKLYASIPYEIRNGSDYRKWKNFLIQEINTEEYELLKLKETVAYAYQNTAYYKKLFDELQVSPFEINAYSDLEKLPYIDKDIVRENFGDFVVGTFPKNKTFYVTTGGTSGSPMKFLQSNNVWKKELAFIMNFFGQYGYKPSMIKASFRGGEFDGLPLHRYWKYNPVHNEIHFSPFHISDTTIKDYVRDLNKHKVEFFHAYPSSLLLLIEHMKNNSLQLDYEVKAIFLISESFSIEDIKNIQSFFDCDVSSFYGHSERLIFAPSYADDLSSYKVERRYGYFELVDTHGNKITENQYRGEIVGTGFDNLVMPLIRYKTNDFTEFINFDERIISLIEGRWLQEYLDGRDGVKLYLTALNMHSDIFKNVIKYQWIQSRPGVADLTLITNNVFSDIDKKQISVAINKKAGHTLSVKIKIVESIILTQRGKFKNIVKNYTELVG